MLDIIHVFFEEDMIPNWEHGAELKSKSRSMMYRTMYGKEYKYGFTSDQGRDASWATNGGPPAASMYDEPIDGSIKPYIPPSTDEELFDIIGAPMGE